MNWRRQASLMLCMLALAAGGSDAQSAVAVSATRVIYLEGDRQRTLMLANTGETPLLVQTWVDRGEGDASMPPTPFVVLPAVLLLNPAARQTLRVLHVDEVLPQDRESVFWINLYQIPAKTYAANLPGDTARVDVAMNLQLKVFYRPAGLAVSGLVEASAQALVFRLDGGAAERCLVVSNPTPWHVSFSRLALQSGAAEYAVEQVMDMMVAPFSERSYRLGRAPLASSAMHVSYGILNDAGQEQGFVAPLSGRPSE